MDIEVSLTREEWVFVTEALEDKWQKLVYEQEEVAVLIEKIKDEMRRQT